MEETHSGWLWIGHCEEFFIGRVYWYFYASHLGYNGYFMCLPPKLTENYNGGGLSENLEIFTSKTLKFSPFSLIFSSRSFLSC
jgi:hypothetical protein